MVGTRRQGNGTGKQSRQEAQSSKAHGDWVDVLDGNVIKILEVIPVVGKLISAFTPDPVE
jgi:hypothetical protein